MPTTTLLTQDPGIRDFPTKEEAKVGAMTHPWCQDGRRQLDPGVDLLLQLKKKLFFGWLFKDSLCQPLPSLLGTVWKHRWVGPWLTVLGACGLWAESASSSWIELRALGHWSCLGLSLPV